MLLAWESEFGKHEGPIVFKHLLNGVERVHSHDFMELVIITGGSGTHVSNFGETELTAGNSILIRPNNWHSYVQAENLEINNFCFPIRIVRSNIGSVLDHRVRSLLLSGKPIQFVDMSPEVVETVRWSFQTQRSPFGSLGLVLWALDQFATALPEHIHITHPAIEQAIFALEDDLSSDWSAAQLAQHVGLDRSYLSRLFKAQVGLSPMQYLALIRLEHAASLLRGGTLNCSQVGAAVGYSDPNLFSRRFRKMFGISPSDYRANTRVVKLE